ncbi:MAG: ATP-binding cassette domain-containing protein [Saprospiraceae bacterium]|nr:ATP-binding cassette domain-containing protein [Saprospiraceae bacterium]
MINCKNLSVQKDKTSILKGIDFEIKPNENWAIIGENGSGKSTLLRALAGKKFVPKGQIERQQDLKIVLLAGDFQANRLVQQAYQFYQQRYNADAANLAPTVYEIVQNQLKPLNTTHAASVILPPKDYDDLEVERVATLLKINHLLHQKVVTLSNGETRRVHLLMALLKQPHILLLDNPFVGLDAASRQSLQNILNTIANSGVSIVLVCAAAEIPDCMTHVLVLKNGEIAHILRGDTIEHFKTEKVDNQRNIDKSKWSKIYIEPQNNHFQYALRMRQVSVVYNNRKVLNGIDWTVQKGEKWALLGPNGSGKSTLLSLIMADNPQGYRNDFDLFDRKRGSGESIWDIKKRIGFVSPELQLYASTSAPVWAVVATGLFDIAQLIRPLTKAEKETVDTYLDCFDLLDLQNKRLHQLSSGQQRKVFLARALVKNPPLLILDEPCQGLDSANMVYFRELVNETVVSLNKTLIYVTHYEEEIPTCVNHIFRIENGQRI